jgi:hypothetical protein
MPLWQRSADPAIMTAIDQVASTKGLAELLLNSTGGGIYGVDLEGNCTLANPACIRLLGFESDGELLGRNMHNLVHHSLPNGAPYAMEDCRIYQGFRVGALGNYPSSSAASGGTSTACASRASRGAMSRTSRWVEARTTGAATPS